MPKSIEKKLFITSAIFGVLGVISASITNIPSASATTDSSASSDVTVTLSDIIALRILDSTASSEISSLVLSLTPTPNGVFTKGSFNVEGSTSNVTGYKLYMTSIDTNPVSNGSGNGDNGDSSSGGDSGDNSENSSSSGNSGINSNATYTTDLVNTDASVTGDTGLIPTLVLPSGVDTITEAEFRVSNSNYKNMWGYSLNGLTVSSTTNPSTGLVENTITENSDTSAITYTSIPAHSTNTLVDEFTSSVESGLTPVTIGVNVSNSKASGTYKNTLEFTAIANEIPIDYKLTFNANTDGAGGEDMSQITNLYSPLTYSSIASSHTFTLPNPADNSNALIRDNYMFSGWNTKPDGTGDTYKAGAEYTIVIDDTDPYSNENTLYATWKPLPNFWKIANMQDMTTTVCNSVYTPTNATELTTPKAIMIDKLAAQAGKYEATSDNTSPNVAQSTLSDIRDGKTYTVRKMADGNCWMAENLKFELQANKTYTGVNNTTGNTITFSTGAICGNGNTNAACIMNGNTAYNSTYDSWYYSWYAATAGSGTASMTTDSGDATNSICPAHWRLPTNYTNKQYPSGGAPKSWGTLVSAYGISPENHNSTTEYQILEANPLNLPRAGYFESGAFYNSGRGNWWSTTARSTATYAYGLNFYTTLVYPQNIDRIKYSGYTVRCVAL